MRGSLQILLQCDQPHGWWIRSTVEQISLLAIHESYGLSDVPTEIVPGFREGGEGEERIASWKVEREERGNGNERIASWFVTI